MKTIQQFITVAGIQWCTENYVSPKGRTHFTWFEAICLEWAIFEPMGLRLPTNEEQKALEFLAKRIESGVCYLKSDYGNSELSFPLAGYCYTKNSSINHKLHIGCYWSGTKTNTKNAYHMYLNYDSCNNIYTKYLIGKSYALSIRCVKI